MSTSEILLQQYRKEKEDKSQWDGILKADRGDCFGLQGENDLTVSFSLENRILILRAAVDRDEIDMQVRLVKSDLFFS
jgi:hypothetical protein